MNNNEVKEIREFIGEQISYLTMKKVQGIFNDFFNSYLIKNKARDIITQLEENDCEHCELKINITSDDVNKIGNLFTKEVDGKLRKVVIENVTDRDGILDLIIRYAKSRLIKVKTNGPTDNIGLILCIQI